MSHYTAYLIARDGHHIKAVDLECVDDDAAKKRAEQMADVSNVELWEHARRIAPQSSPFDCGDVLHLVSIRRSRICTR
jgi:hypothetical protein